jgi:hypothetical protein
MTGREKPSKDRRTERRAAALRENLKRRKAQARGRGPAGNKAARGEDSESS